MTITEAKKIIKSECYIADLLNLDRTWMVNTALDTVIEAAEQQPKTGHWIDRQVQNKIDGEIRKAGECSKCHSIYFRYDLSQNVVDDIPNYCPHCGARMESDSE